MSRVCFYVVFPFIPAMIRELGIVNSDEEIGYRAGLIVRVFFFGGAQHVRSEYVPAV